MTKSERIYRSEKKSCRVPCQGDRYNGYLKTRMKFNVLVFRVDPQGKQFQLKAILNFLGFPL